MRPYGIFSIWLDKSEAFISIVCYHLTKKSEKNTDFLDLGAFEALLLICGDNLELFRNGFFNTVNKINLTICFWLFFFSFFLTMEQQLTDEEIYLSQITVELLRPL